MDNHNPSLGHHTPVAANHPDHSPATTTIKIKTKSITKNNNHNNNNHNNHNNDKTQNHSPSPPTPPRRSERPADVIKKKKKKKKKKREAVASSGGDDGNAIEGDTRIEYDNNINNNNMNNNMNTDNITKEKEEEEEDKHRYRSSSSSSASPSTEHTRSHSQHPKQVHNNTRHSNNDSNPPHNTEVRHAANTVYKRPLDNPDDEDKVQQLVPGAMEGARRHFYEHLFRFLLRRGPKGLPRSIPKMGFKELDMYTLFYRIVAEGGFDRASESEGMWIRVFRDLPDNFRPTITNASVRLKRYYTRFLLGFEQYFLHDGGAVPGRVVFVVYERRGEEEEETTAKATMHGDGVKEKENYGDEKREGKEQGNEDKEEDGDGHEESSSPGNRLRRSKRKRTPTWNPLLDQQASSQSSPSDGSESYSLPDESDNDNDNDINDDDDDDYRPSHRSSLRSENHHSRPTRPSSSKTRTSPRLQQQQHSHQKHTAASSLTSRSMQDAAAFTGRDKNEHDEESLTDLHPVMRIHAHLYDTPTARALLPSMPFLSPAQYFGDLWFFHLSDTLPTIDKESNAREVVETGEIAFWTEQPSILVGFGSTPASQERETRLVTQCNVIGRVLPQDISQLSQVKRDDVIRMEIASPDAAEYGNAAPRPKPQPQPAVDPEAGEDRVPVGEGGAMKTDKDHYSQSKTTTRKKKKRKVESHNDKHPAEDPNTDQRKGRGAPDPQTLLQLGVNEDETEMEMEDGDGVAKTQDAAIATEDSRRGLSQGTSDGSHGRSSSSSRSSIRSKSLSTATSHKSSAASVRTSSKKRSASSADLNSPRSHSKRARTTPEEHNTGRSAMESSRREMGEEAGPTHPLTLKYHEYGQSESNANLIKRQTPLREVGLPDIYGFLQQDNVDTESLSEVRVFEYASDEDGEGWLLLDPEWQCPLHPSRTTRLRLKLKHNRE